MVVILQEFYRLWWNKIMGHISLLVADFGQIWTTSATKPAFAALPLQETGRFGLSPREYN